MKKPTYRNHHKRLPKVLTAYELNCKAKRAYESEFEDRFKKWSFWRYECDRKRDLTVGLIELTLGILAFIYGIFLGFTTGLAVVTVAIGVLILYLCYKDNKIFLYYKREFKDKYVEEKIKDLTK